MIHHRIAAHISLDAIEYNFDQMRKKIPPDARIIAVIKADGYGHGAVPIAKMAEEWPFIWGFAVACPVEALELREAGIRKPILILGLVFPESYEQLASLDIRIPVMDVESAKGFADAALKAGKEAIVHIPIDTGMSRIGLAPFKESVDIIRKIEEIPGLQIEGMFTHFARADEYDTAPAYNQLERFNEFEKALIKENIDIPLIHCSNSAGIMRVPEAHKKLVRAGISIYGIYPSDEVERDTMPLRPAMSLTSNVTLVKEVPAGTPVSYGGTYVSDKAEKLATVPVGYADGYPRLLSGKGWVLIRGQKAPIRGRVCMDQMMVDVTGIEGVKAGDVVTLLGRDGEEEITADTLGSLSGRFPYELVCCVNKRVPRIYTRDGKEWGTVI